MYSSLICEKELPTALPSRNTCQMYNKPPPIRKQKQKENKKKLLEELLRFFLCLNIQIMLLKKSIEELPDANKTYHRADHFIKKKKTNSMQILFSVKHLQ